MTNHPFSCQVGIAFLCEFTRGMRFGELQSKVCKKESNESFSVDLEHEGPVLDSGDLVV